MLIHEITGLTEAHHAYDGDTDPKDFAPIVAGDTVRVFHGFNSLHDAVNTARHGLSGRVRADRRYSFENDNNPYGLFVTLDLKISREFTSGVQDQVAIEFVAPEEDLEAPVWPGGSFTVQGQMAQYFGHGREGRLNRRAAGREAEARTAQAVADDSYMSHVARSDRKHMVGTLTMTREQQALFVGDLNPEDIVAFHVRPKGSAYNAPFERLSREEFLDRYAEVEADEKRAYRDRIFLPRETFDPEKFRAGMVERYRFMADKLDQTLAKQWQVIASAKSPAREFEFRFGRFFWPAQYRDALLWFKRTYGGRKREGV